MTEPRSNLTATRILLFWAPLSATWLMMSVEGPFLSAVIARLAEPKFNLAAYGVAFSLALLVEAPIIMIMSAATALVSDRDSLRKMQRFTYTLNTAITGAIVILVLPPVFNLVALDLINLPPPVAELTHAACLFMIPWPAAIGYRRLYQGVLIRSGRTSYVAYGTIIRLTTMAATALVMAWLDQPGAHTGAAALGVGVVAEAAASRFMARRVVAELQTRPPEPGNELTYGDIIRFYTPLALTTILALGVRPLVTLFVGQSRMALESLAVLPVVHSLVFIFMSFGFSFHEAAIALFSEDRGHYRPLRNFAIGLGTVTFIGLAIIGFTPASGVWLHHISGLSRELTAVALLPVRISVLAPALAALIFFERSALVQSRTTKPIILATAAEVSAILLGLYIGIGVIDAVGANAASSALMAGMVTSALVLWIPFRFTLRRWGVLGG